MTTTEHPNPPLPPLTAEDFGSGGGYTFRGIKIVEDEDANWVYAYGHIDPETFAAAVNEYDQDVAGTDPGDGYVPDSVTHRHAITLIGPEEPDGWWITWADVTEETPGSFPVTVVSR